MKRVCLSQFCALFLSFLLLISPLPLTAIIETTMQYEAEMKQHEQMFDDNSYVHLDKQPHSIAELVAAMCAIDDNEMSPFHELNHYIADGLMIADRTDILRVLEYADWFLEQQDTLVKQEQRIVLQDTIDDLIEAIVDNHLAVDIHDVIYKSKYPLWVINKRLLVKGKTKLDSELIVQGKTRLHDRARFYKKAHFKENIVVDGVASLQDAVIQNLDLAGGLTISDITLTTATIADAVIDNLQVNNCMPHLCVEDLSVVEGSVSGTLSINDAVVQNLDLAGGLTISDITLTTATIADAVIDNLQVNNCVTNLCVQNLSVTNETVSGTLSANDAIVQHLDIAQNSIHFLDSSNTNYVGMSAPTAVPTSYSVQLPAAIPTGNQVLRANVSVPTHLEWATLGGSVPPSTSETIYVAQYGSDVSGDGSFAEPYASLAKAIDVANSLSSAGHPITIIMNTGVYVEDNSAGPLTITAQGISIVASSPTSVIVMPTTLSNDFLLATQAVIVSNMSFVASGVSTATGISLTHGFLSTLVNVRVIGFQTGVACSGGSFDSYMFYNCSFVGNGTGFLCNDTVAECYNCNFIGTDSLSVPQNNGAVILGSTSFVVIDGGIFGLCQTALNINNNAYVTVNAMTFEFNVFDLVQTTGAQTSLTGCSFQLTSGSSDIKVQASGAGTNLQISSCKFNGNNVLGLPQATAIMVSDNAQVNISSSGIYNYNVGLQIGIPSDASTTVLEAFSLLINNSLTYDILQQGSSSLNFTSSSANASKISINDATNVQTAFFDMDDNNALTIGSSADMDTVLLQPYISQTNHPSLEFLASLYATQGMGFNNQFGFPTTLYSLANNNSRLAAITTLRTDIAGVRLVSDTASPVGGTTALRGWDINKNGSTAELSFNYQNSDPAGQSIISEYTVMQLDGVNNQLQLPTTGTEIVFGGDTNLYRSSANVLKTDDNLIVGTLTPNRVVVTNSITNQLASSIVTDTELSYVSGVTSSIQTQLNGKVSKTGDIMTGTLQLPAGSVALPSLTFTGSTTTGLSASSSNLSLSANGAEVMKLSSAGVVSIDGFVGTAGVVHNDVSGNLSSSKIVDADIASATITNDKLATVSSLNVANALVVRDGSGNFQTNQITILGSVTNPTDAATKAYVDTAASAGLEVKNPALVASTTNVTISGLQIIDGVALSANDRVLLVGQTNAVQNGLWLAQVGAWTRPADFASGTEAGAAYVLVTSGNTYAGASWVCNTPTAIIDTDPLGFSQFTLPSETTGANIGAGTGLVFANKTGETLNFRSLIAGSHLTYTTNTSDITLTTDATNANTASTIVARDASGNFSAGTITANLTGSASNNVLKTGDTMTGPLTLPAGTTANPSLNFTGSTTTGLSVPTVNTLSFSTNGAQAMSISSTGVVAINNLTPAGVVHNDLSGNLSSSLIVNADISSSAAIADTKLATISSAGKVANSATTATSSNTANTIVARDASGNFTAGTITASLNGSASNNVLKAGDTMTGTLQLPAGSNASPSLTFTGSTTAGLSANTGNLSFNTNALERMKISSGGVISIDGFTTVGVVHNDASGNLSTSLIVNADVDPAAGIIDTKLATISTAGKVANSATTATSANTASTIVARDASGNFSAGTITASLNGNATTATTATTATNFSGSLSGDVTGTQSATVVSFVGGVTAADVANATAVVDAATNTNTANTLVLRDGTGSFAAQNISMVDGIALGFLSIPTTASLSVGTIQQNGVSLIHTKGINNTFVGQNAGNFTTSGTGNNTAVGKSALTANTTGIQNTAIGSNALPVNTTGLNNTAVGYIALQANTSGQNNTALGAGALFATTTGQNNTAIGINAGGGITTGSNNVMLGTVGGALTTGSNNIYINGFPLNVAVNESDTIRIGNTQTSAFVQGVFGVSVTSPQITTINASGQLGSTTTAGLGTSTNTANTLVARDGTGSFAAQNISMVDGIVSGFLSIPTTSSLSVGTIQQNGVSLIHTFGTNNTFVGQSSGNFTMSGSGNNTAVGKSALAANTTGFQNTAVGSSALALNTTGINNTALGTFTLSANTFGTNNAAVGYNALTNNTAGIQNTAIGSGALAASSTVSNNTACGYNALNATTVGSNTAVGASALAANTTGVNTAVGSSALAANTTGTNNTAVGQNAIAGNTIGTQNTAVGHNALQTSTTGIRNTVLGSDAGAAVSTGSNNVLIGYTTGSALTTGNNNIYIDGSGNLTGAAAESNTIRIGNAMASCFIQGISGVSVSSPQIVTVASNGQLGSTTTSGLGTNLNTPNTLVARDGTGSFAAQDVSMVDGIVSGFLSIPTTTSLSVGTIQQNNLSLLHTFGSNNIFLGQSAGNFTTSGFGSNIGIGENALEANTTGSLNIAIGVTALAANTIGLNNVAVGSSALSTNTTGIKNIAIGSVSLLQNTIGSSNVAVGNAALTHNTTGSQNIAVGDSALLFNTTGQNNVAVGTGALSSNTIGIQNTALGTNALNASVASNNTAVGYIALLSNTTGNQNTAIGSNALGINTTGSNNTAIGYAALNVATVGSNTAVGASALAVNTTGVNTAVGASALTANTTGNNNTAVGQNALAANTTGAQNTAVGSGALATSATVTNNAAFGYNALNLTTVGSNTAVGASALAANTTGVNTAVGAFALSVNTTGTSNTAVGQNALEANTIGTFNTAVGIGALSSNITAIQNTAIGAQALLVNTTGFQNTVIGASAGSAVTNGANNVLIGFNVGSLLTTGSNNIYIDGSSLSPANESNTIRIGNTQTSAFMQGIFGVSVTSPQITTINASGQLGSTTTAGLGTSANTPNTLVARDGSGSFAAQDVTMVDGIASGFLSIPTTTSLSVGTIQQNGVSLIHTFGTNNTFVGQSAGNFTMSGTGNNTAVGQSALAANTTGNNNTAVGQNALAANTTGAQNTAIGAGALGVNTTGGGNTALGQNALAANTTGQVNVAVGRNALLTNSFGNSNVAIGSNALASNTTGTQNVGIGVNALTLNITGTDNIAIGLGALSSSTTGIQNIALGTNALASNTTGNNNIAIGQNSLNNNTTGIQNTAVGIGTLQTAVTVTNNTAFGYNALHVATVGSNTAVGASALAANTTGVNTAMGASALAINTTGTNNTAVGQNALTANTIGSQNTAIGTGALATSTTVSNNTAVGYNALHASTASSNTAVGASALTANTTGISNTAIGFNTLSSNLSGISNTAIGDNALSTNTASFNTAVGHNALTQNSTGASNTVIGSNALQANTTGLQNTVIGASAGIAVTTGSNNVLVGFDIGGSLTTGGNNIYIDGSSGITGSAAESNTIRIGSSQTACFIQGINGQTSASGVAVLVNSSGQLGTTTSSRNVKHAINPMLDASEKIYQLEPVTFIYNSDATDTLQYGLIAEEVEQVFPALVAKDNQGQPYTVRYEVLPVLLLNEMKKQKDLNDQLNIVIEQHDIVINNLLERVAALESCL